MREQITDILLCVGVEPLPPFVESLLAKVIGELVAANERSVSIVPADIAQELARVAGVAIVRHAFGWTQPPITLFERHSGERHEEQLLFAQALRDVYARWSRREGYGRTPYRAFGPSSVRSRGCTASMKRQR
ncbi:hypothetical protein AcdelDRAFT_1505 [Acidovorax delafieldii 2AN]|jgi:hypothetical protein|uniref:Uncharacterized protein n=2 Tax=Acidovorax delafieldii TaxID=47920 RepID=C5T3M2_ACIDE|nr:hypothetical protein AcdelDRAFT_1505 [Acidovorax delafieldii 2AN]